MEERLMEFAQTLDIRNSRGFQAGWQIKCKTLNLIRYADDFVILHKDIKVVLQAKTIIQEWLSQVGLELKPEKTRIAHPPLPHAPSPCPLPRGRALQASPGWK